jgi:hypothetical protein
MAWSKIPSLQGNRAADNWLHDISPEREARVRKNYDQNVSAIERTLGDDKKLLLAFRTLLAHKELFGRVKGLREGLDLYEYGMRIQEKNSEAFRSIMNYVVRKAKDHPMEDHDLGEAVSAQSVCTYLDKQISKVEVNWSEAGIKESHEKRIAIRPPKQWGCVTWREALKNKRNDVEKLISKAKKEGLSQEYCTLIAWKMWGRRENTEDSPQPDD